MKEQVAPADASSERARLILVEEGLQRLERSVESLATNISKYIAEQSGAPRTIPFKEIIITAGATFALFVAGLNFMDQRNEMATKDMRFIQQQHAKQLERLAPLTYSTQLKLQ